MVSQLKKGQGANLWSLIEEEVTAYALAMDGGRFGDREAEKIGYALGHAIMAAPQVNPFAFLRGFSHAFGERFIGELNFESGIDELALAVELEYVENGLRAGAKERISELRAERRERYNNERKPCRS